MRFRFLYLGPAGAQIEVPTLDELRVRIEEGTVGEATPLFDVLTQQWAPARAHAVYRLLVDESRARRPASPSVPDLPDLGLTVTEVPAAADTEEAVRALLRERERDERAFHAPRTGGFTESAAWSEPVPAKPEAPEPVAAPTARSRADARPIRGTGGGEPPAPRATPAEAPSLLTTPIHLDQLRAWGMGRFGGLMRLAEHRRAPAVLILAGVLGLGSLLFTVLSAGTAGDGARDASAAPSGSEVRRLVGRFALAQDSGFRHMVAGIDSLRMVHGVETVPPVWLEGRYLAHASRFPEVRDYWVRYRAFLGDVQASDTALFRAGFVRQLRNDGVQGPVLSLRLSQAMTEFESTQPSRSTMYVHMDELAGAALALHDLLVEREGDISFEPALDARLSEDPVVEALPTDEVVRDRMWVLLDRIFASLEQLGGGEFGANRSNLTQALLDRVEASR